MECQKLDAVVNNAAESVEAMQMNFEKAMAACPDAVSEHHYTVSNMCINLRIVGRRLAQELTPPFEHLRNGAPSMKPGLTIDVWDQEETGVKGIPGGKCDSENVFGVLMASPDGRYVVEERADKTS